MLQGFGYLGLHCLDRNTHFPGNFLISLPFLPTFAINLPTICLEGNKQLLQSIDSVLPSPPKYQQQEHIHILLLPRWNRILFIA